jgi:hypothetical protein
VRWHPVALGKPARRHTAWLNLWGFVLDMNHNRERGVIELNERESVCGALRRWHRWW